MPDEAAPAHSPESLQSELDKSRETSARLMDNLARKIGASRAVHTAAGGIERAAHYVQHQSVRGVASEIERAIRRRPIVSMAVAAAAGFFIARAFRSPASRRDRLWQIARK